jgi:hypothetical protein
MTSLEEWIERNVDRRSARQRVQVETAKLLATFAISLAATLIASALQVAKSKPWDIAASGLLALAFIGLLVVIALDRTTEVDQEDIFRYGNSLNWTSDEIIDSLRFAMYVSVKNNEAVVATVKLVAQAQVAASVLAGAFAIISLLR